MGWKFYKIPLQGFKCKKYGKHFWQNLPLWCTVERRCHFSICTNSSCSETCRDIGIGLFYHFGIHLWYWTGSQLFLTGSQLIFPGKKMELTPNWLTATTFGRITLLNLLGQNRHTLQKKREYWLSYTIYIVGDSNGWDAKAQDVSWIHLSLVFTFIRCHTDARNIKIAYF